MTSLKKYIIYIGDFDIRNNNVQSFLVRNNGSILNSLGYNVAYIGVNTNERTFKAITKLSKVPLINDDRYLELPNTLNVSGVFKYIKVLSRVISYINEISKSHSVDYLISYQSPTYSLIINSIAHWCRANQVTYIVNCADLPIFNQQPFLRKLVMKTNWNILHKLNLKYAHGVISVSTYIESFYRKPVCHYVVIPPLFNPINRREYVTETQDVVSFIYAGTPFKNRGRVINPKAMKDRLDIVIDLFLRLSDSIGNFRLTVVGITKEEYCTGVPRHNMALSKNVHIIFTGKVNHETTLDMIYESDFSINYRDVNHMNLAGFSTKIVESISLGTPVVTNSIGDTFRYIKNGTSGFVLSGNMEADLELLIALCKMHKEERKRLKDHLIKEQIFDTSKYIHIMFVFLSRLKESTKEVH
jgi:glycosyltransferase involved in cell wall biosynthesis